MSHFSGKQIAGVLISSVSLLAGSFAHAESLHDRMQQAVKAAYAGSGHDADASLQHLESVNALQQVQVEGADVFLSFTWMPKYNAFTLDNGKRLTVDFKDTVLLGHSQVAHPMIESFEASSVAADSGIRTRLVVTFTEAVGFQEVVQDNAPSLLIQHKADALTSKMTGVANEDAALRLAFLVSAPVDDAPKPLMALSKDVRLDFDSVASQFKGIMPANSQEKLHLSGMQAVGQARVDFLNFGLAFDAADDDADVAEGGNEAQDFPVSDAETIEEESVRPPMPRIDIAPVTSTTNTEIAGIIRDIETGEDEETAGSVVTSFEPSPAMPARQNIAMDTTKPRFVGDPLNQLVNVDFREMDLSNVVALLAHKAGINVIAGTDLVGVVTANLRNVTLRRAMEEALRMNGLGMIEDGGIYRIVTIQEKMATDRVREIIEVDNASAKDIAKILDDITKGSLEAPFINISSNDQKNVVIVSGPTERVQELASLARQLDVAEPRMQTVTELFKLNYADPLDVEKAITKQLSPQGKIGVDARARQLVVTDEPLIVDHLRNLVNAMDISVKQVVIESLIVDITLADEASTGVDWLLSSVRSLNQRGEVIGSLQELGLGTALGLPNVASVLNFGVLSDNINWTGIVQAEIRNQNGRLHSNPVIVTMENKPARIAIAQEIPFVELKSTEQGGQQTTTEFKDIGTILEVTPRVTHDNDILVSVYVKESNVAGEFNGIPIENVREAESELRTGNGQTIFIGGLRKNGHDSTIRKVPILGDVPVFNVMFRQNVRNERVNELMVFMTNTVLEEKLSDLDRYQQMKVDNAYNAPMKTDAQNALLHDMIYPHENRDPAWKFRRSE